MTDILSWLAWGLGAIVLVAMVVAGWEHLVREARGQRRFHRVAPPVPPARTLPVDVRLDTEAAALTTQLPEPADPPTDRQNRLAAMAEALSRASDASRIPEDRGRWADTTPRVVGLGEPALEHRDRPRQKRSNPHA